MPDDAERRALLAKLGKPVNSGCTFNDGSKGLCLTCPEFSFCPSLNVYGQYGNDP